MTVTFPNIRFLTVIELDILGNWKGHCNFNLDRSSVVCKFCRVEKIKKTGTSCIYCHPLLGPRPIPIIVNPNQLDLFDFFLLMDLHNSQSRTTESYRVGEAIMKLVLLLRITSF